MPRGSKIRSDAFADPVPELLVMGDLHASPLTPECRTDSYPEAVVAALSFVSALQRRYDCPVIWPGDLFDHWKADSVFLNKVLEVWPAHSLAVMGQHDLPQHNLELSDKTAFRTLELSGKLVRLLPDKPYTYRGLSIYGASWGETPMTKLRDAFPVLVAHVSVWEEPYAPGQKPSEASRYLKQHAVYRAIFTGDTHSSFSVAGADGRVLVNQGSVLHTRSDQMNHVPRVCLWSRADGVHQVDIPVKPGIVTRELRDRLVARDERTSAFVQRLESTDDVSLTFDDNVDALLKEEPDPAVQQLVLTMNGR